jgi:DUF4097 and DUF4098 domain-containing protein YvlB
MLIVSTFLPGCVLSAALLGQANPQPPPPPPPAAHPQPKPPKPPKVPAEASGDQGGERLSKTFTVGPNGSLFLNNISGDVDIKAVSGNEIKVEALRHGRPGGGGDDTMQVTMNEVSGRVEVRAVPMGGRGHRGSVDFSISVPPTTRVEVQSVSGDLRITGVKGELRAETTSGDVTASGLGRVSSLKSLSGGIHVTGADTDSDLMLSAVSGDIVVENLKARGVDANSVSGGVTLKGCACSRVHMQSVSGDLNYVGNIDKTGRYEIKTHSGGIHLAVPANAGFEVDANSFSGDIKFDPPISTVLSQGRGRGPGQMAHGVVGNGGAFLELSSFSGDITVSRGGK